MTHKGAARILLVLVLLVIILVAVGFRFGFGGGSGTSLPGAPSPTIQVSNPDPKTFSAVLGENGTAEDIMKEIGAWRSKQGPSGFSIVIKVSPDAQASQKDALEKQIEAAGLSSFCRYEMTK